MSNILVTGGAGFIGSHLWRALMRDNHRVIIIDNFNDFYDPKIKKRNIDELKDMMLDEDLELNALSIVTGICEILKHYLAYSSLKISTL